MSNARSLLPPNAAKAERDLEAATARLSDIPVPLRELWNPDTCPLPLLPWLAWAYSVDKWDPTWTEGQKRAVVRNSLLVHRYKGTKGAVERAFAALGYGLRVVEWFEEEPRADAFTFRIDIQIGDKGIDEPMYSTMERFISDAKNVRSHLSGLRLAVRSDALLSLAAVVSMGEEVFISAAPAPEISTPGGLLFQPGSLQEINLYTRP